jgi:hypothetical protein
MMPGKGASQLTGKLGEVIRESAQIALSWTKAHAHALGVTEDLSTMILNDRDVHVHMPEGSIGKEGPSAGTALLSAFVSLFTKTPISPDIAMTGEISLVGQILPVGGLKEKILAVHRAGIKMILAPAGGAGNTNGADAPPRAPYLPLRLPHTHSIHAGQLDPDVLQQQRQQRVRAPSSLMIRSAPEDVMVDITFLLRLCSLRPCWKKAITTTSHRALFVRVQVHGVGAGACVRPREGARGDKGG